MVATLLYCYGSLGFQMHDFMRWFYFVIYEPETEPLLQQQLVARRLDNQRYAGAAKQCSANQLSVYVHRRGED